MTAKLNFISVLDWTTHVFFDPWLSLLMHGCLYLRPYLVKYLFYQFLLESVPEIFLKFCTDTNLEREKNLPRQIFQKLFLFFLKWAEWVQNGHKAKFFKGFWNILSLFLTKSDLQWRAVKSIVFCANPILRKIQKCLSSVFSAGNFPVID